MMKIFLSLIDLFFSEMHKRNGRLKRARKSLDRVINRNHGEFEFLPAYDAFLTLREDRLPEAQLKFEKCLREISKSPSLDEKYISLYCRFFLSIYNSTGEAQKFRSEALKLEPDLLTKTFLRFPSEEKLEQIISG